MIPRPTYHYKTSIELVFNNYHREIDLTLVCEIWGGEVEVTGVVIDDPAANKSRYIQALVEDIYQNFDFDHLQDAILSEAIADREADRIDRIMDDMKSPELEPVR